MKTNSRTKLYFALLFTLCGFLSLMPPIVKAQGSATIDGPAPNDAQDPPTRVARVSLVEGPASLQPGGTGDWGAASKNRPMTIGDKLWTDQSARVELQAGQAALHLGGMTALSFLNLDRNITQVRLAEGNLNFRVRELREGDVYEVDTPNAAFTVTEAGAFHIDVNENGDATAITAIRGSGEIAAGGQSYTVHAGERADINGLDNDVRFAASVAADPDALDRWAQQRDLKEEHSASARYVSRDVVGYSDLDDYGTWRDEPEYGHVWVPSSVDPGWAPYSSGYWNWVGPWGWTWVDDSPWGFAPFHYGRWNYFGSYWGWCPGPIYATPYYGPAFVGFLGGGGFGFGFGFGGGVGWFPLGWGEPYRPWYHCGGDYWRNVNIYNTHITNVNIINTNNYNNYAYAHNVNAVSTASHNTFVNGQAINRGNGHVTEASLLNAHITHGVNAAPTKASFLGASGVRGRVATPSASVQNRAVVARTAPAAAASHLPVRTMNSAGLNASGIGGGQTSASARVPGNPRSASSNRPGFSNSTSPTQNRPGFSNSTSPAQNRPGFSNSASPTQNRPGFSNSTSPTQNRPGQLNSNRPPSAYSQGPRSASGSNNAAPRQNTSTRTWNTQGNTADSGRAPRGFANPSTNSVSAPANQPNRPPWARSTESGAAVSHARTVNESAPRNSTNRPASLYNGPSSGNRPPNQPSYNNNRSYSSPAGNNRGSTSPSYNSDRGSSSPSYNNRSYSPPSYNNNRAAAAPSYNNRSYSPPSYNNNRGYSAPRENPSPRSYSAPSYSAPRGSSTPSYSAPRGSGGGSGGYRGGGGSSGGSHGGGSSPNHH